MTGLLKAFLKYTGYTLFFLAAFGLFFYLTLPMDEVKSFLVRTASDQYNLDLEIDDLALSGVSTFKASGVILTPRPTPAEIQEMEAALKARKEAKERIKAQEESAGADPADIAVPPDLPDPTKMADGAPAPAGPLAARRERGRKKPKGAKGKKKKEIELPPLPKGPQPLEVSDLEISIDPMAAMKGQITGSLSSSLMQGTLAATFDHNADALELDADAEGLDMAQLTLIRDLLPVPLQGELSLKAKGDVGRSDKGAFQLASINGDAELNIVQIKAGPGKIPTKRMGEVEFPVIRIDRLGGTIEFAQKKATFRNVTFSGRDVEGEITGYITLHNDAKRWRPNAHIRWKFSEEFLKDHGDVKFLMGSSEMKRGTDAEGFTGFTLRGSFSKPNFQPRKKSPFKKKATRASGKKKTKKAKARKTPKRTKKSPKARARRKATSGRRVSARSTKADTEDPAIKPPRPMDRPGPGDIADTEDDEPEEDEPEDDEPEDDEPEDDEPEDEEPEEGDGPNADLEGDGAGAAGGGGGPDDNGEQPLDEVP